jgi:RHH-type proline utilization regulon transcriptional repressor/proline dehydrogenase/delta 1-pyrroline-5-carboxylate dehydrogenase
MVLQIGAALATGNHVRMHAPPELRPVIAGLPRALRPYIAITVTRDMAGCDAVLFEGTRDALLEIGQKLAAQEGPIVPVLGRAADAADGEALAYQLEMLLLEQAISTNTAAAGGNASLMAIG